MYYHGPISRVAYAVQKLAFCAICENGVKLST